MRRLTIPPFDVATTLVACTTSITDAGLSSRLTSIGADLSAAEHQYLTLASTAGLYTTIGSDGVSGQVSTSEMGRVYKGTFAKSRRTRHIYDAIKKASANDICPLCGQRTVSTLDHYLPWTAHPSLAITPVNLVPACADCNKAKLAYVSATEGDQLLHPYFDHFDGTQWIFAEVIVGSPSALRFEARPPNNWPTSWKLRATKHFKIYGLGALYGSHAAEELINIRHSLVGLGSALAVQQYLAGQWKSRADAYVNSWNTAAYQAWSGSPWFCQGGYLT